MRTLLAVGVALAALVAFPGAAAAESYVVLQRQISTADNQITTVRGYHEACGHTWLVSQEVHWGVITATKATVKSVRFRYYLPNGGIVRGGRASVFNANGYKTADPADRSAIYQRIDPPDSYAGTWNWGTVSKTFTGGQTNGKVVVNVEKHSQWDTYALGADCHGKLIVIYYVP